MKIKLQVLSITFIFALALSISANTFAQTPTNEILLGQIIDKSTQESIQIVGLCQTRDHCDSIAFYHVLGVREAQPFNTTTITSIRNTSNSYDSKESRRGDGLEFWYTNAWLIDYTYPYDQLDATQAFCWIFGIGEVLTVVDTILFPIRGAARLVENAVHGAKHGSEGKKLKKTRAHLYRVLTTGGSIEVSSKTYVRLNELINQF